MQWAQKCNGSRKPSFIGHEQAATSRPTSWTKCFPSEPGGKQYPEIVCKSLNFKRLQSSNRLNSYIMASTPGIKTFVIGNRFLQDLPWRMLSVTWHSFDCICFFEYQVCAFPPVLHFWGPCLLIAPTTRYLFALFCLPVYRQRNAVSAPRYAQYYQPRFW